MFRCASIVSISVIPALFFAASVHAQPAPGGGLSLSTALTLAEGALQACQSKGYHVAVHVLDPSGRILVAMRGDDIGPHSVENSFKKAWTALATRAPSAKFLEQVKANPTAGGLHLANMIPAQGGLPVMIGKETIGSVGVSGAPGGENDEKCSQAGLDKIEAELK